MYRLVVGPEWADAILQTIAAHHSSMGPKALSQALSGCAVMGHTPPDNWMQAHLAAVQVRMPSAGGGVATGKGR